MKFRWNTAAMKHAEWNRSEGTNQKEHQTGHQNQKKKEKKRKRREPNGKARVGKDRLCSIIK